MRALYPTFAYAYYGYYAADARARGRIITPDE